MCSNNQQFLSMLIPARERLKIYSVEELCHKGKLGFDEEKEEFFFDTMGKTIHVHFPDYLLTEELEMWHHLTMLQYMDTADGSQLAGEWISLPQMRGGLSRGQSFDREIEKLAEHNWQKVDAHSFREACRRIGGSIEKGKGDVTAVIHYAPMFPVMVNFWEADDEFSASCKILVDRNSDHYLTIEAAGGACLAVARAIWDNIRL